MITKRVSTPPGSTCGIQITNHAILDHADLTLSIILDTAIDCQIRTLTVLQNETPFEAQPKKDYPIDHLPKGMLVPKNLLRYIYVAKLRKVVNIDLNQME